MILLDGNYLTKKNHIIKLQGDLMKELLTDEFVEKLTDQIVETARGMSAEVVGILAKRIKELGTLTASDVNRMRNTLRITDLKKIEQAISDSTGKGVKEIDQIFEDVAKENEAMSKALYEYRNLSTDRTKEVQEIITAATKNAKEKYLALSDTTVVGMELNGKVSDIQTIYNKLIDNAVFAINQGVTDYTTAIRKTVKELAGNGLVVMYESGYKRRLDSAVRMNILDGCRQMSIAMREQQAKEYGADGWEISAHALARPEHQSPQGRVFSFKEFDELNASLRTPIATGQMNCRHIKFGVIMEINQPAYSDKELKELIDEANEKVVFKGISGEEMKKSRYDCSQYLRYIETSVRKMKDVENALKIVGDTTGVKAVKNDIISRIKEYHRIAAEIGIPERLNRL